MPVGLFFVDQQGRSQWSNARARDLFSADGNGNADWTARVHPEDRARVLGGWQRLLTEGGEQADEFRVVRPDGSQRWLRGRGAAVRSADGAPFGFVGTLEDVTESRAQQELLRGDLDALREGDAAKRGVFNTLSHELRTPLTVLRLQLGLLAREPADARQVAQALPILDRNVRRLEVLIDDMLTVTRLGAGTVELRLHDVDLGELLAQAAASFRPAAARAGLRIEVRPGLPMRARADPERIGQVLDNLLSNAVKYTPRGGSIVLEARRSEGTVCVEVRDSGRGLAPEEIPRLFEPFQRRRRPDEDATDGTGLGLYICKGILEMHGGRIWCESDGRGRGARFCFELPSPP
jgi:PAS domain S-box-containing protein